MHKTLIVPDRGVWGQPVRATLTNERGLVYCNNVMLVCIIVALALFFMVYACGDLYVHADLGLWISRPDLRQLSQISDRGKNVRPSTTGLNCEKRTM
jgi:hypothetical protein